MRVKVVIAYDGSKFYGFQRLVKNGINTHITIESKIEEVLKTLGIDNKILGAGRTDRGVHATGQVISFVVPLFWRDLAKLKKQLNIKLSPYIIIKNIVEIDNTFHPRYNACSRTYRYLIRNTETNPFLNDFVMFKKEIDLKKVNEAMKIFIGKFDFEFFRKTGSDESSTIRTIYNAFAYRYKEQTIFLFNGNGFLRSQVRLMMATVIEYEKGNITLVDIQNQLLKKEKKITKPIIHNGLYLSKIKYG